MKFEEIVAPSMKELFVNNIEKMILSGKLKLGDKLPSERELAQQMKVSRSIVNLGLNELDKKGFVKIIPRKGTYVNDYIRDGELDTLMSIINYNGGRFDRKTFYSLMEFRILNEGLAAKLAALNRTEKDLEELDQLFEEMVSSKTVDEYSEILFELHHLIFYATGNQIYPLVHNAFKNISIIMTNTLFNYFGVEKCTQGIKEVIELIRSQEALKAKKAMEDLIESGVRELEKGYFKD